MFCKIYLKEKYIFKIVGSSSENNGGREQKKKIGLERREKQNYDIALLK